MDNITCFVLGGSTNALGQIRAINQLGYKCINVVEKGLHGWSRKSRYCHGVLAPHPFLEREQCLKFLIDLIKKEINISFLFFASDEWMDMVGENEATFRAIAKIPQSEWPDMSRLFNKKFLYRIAEEHGIPYPKTIEIESIKNAEPQIAGITPPFIVKPQVTVSQNILSQNGITTYHRTQIYESAKEFLDWIKLLLSKGIDFPILIQEYIPGDATTLYTLTSYSNIKGNLLAASIGHKLRQFPPAAGRITSGILEHNTDLFEVGKHFLKSINYHGLANTEFKYDCRDGKFKLMEINTRLGAWNYSALYAGINLIEAAICDTLHREYTGLTYNREKDGKIWYNGILDLFCSVFLNKKFNGGKFRLSYGKWHKSLQKKSFEAVWDKRDPLPFVFYLCYLARTVISRYKI